MLNYLKAYLKRYKTNEFVNKNIGKNLNILRLTEKHLPSYVKATAKNKHSSRRCAVCANNFDEMAEENLKKPDTNAQIVILVCVQLPALKFTTL